MKAACIVVFGAALAAGGVAAHLGGVGMLSAGDAGAAAASIAASEPVRAAKPGFMAAILPIAASSKPSVVDDAGDLKTRIHTIRYGVTTTVVPK